MSDAPLSTGPGSDPLADLEAGFRTVTTTLAAARPSADDPAAAKLDETAPAPVEDPASAPIPVTLLTGFLGSGKTTLLRRLLGGDHGLQLSVVVNDLAALNVDAELLGSPPGGRPQPDSERLDLSNGCACCALSDDLARTLGDAAVGPPSPEAIVVEASGAADGVAMASVIEAGTAIRLDGIVCTVDAERWPEQLTHPRLGPLARRQVETAHIILLTKTDLVTPAATASMTGRLAEIAPGRRIVSVIDGVVDPAVVLGAASLGAALRPAAEPGHAAVAHLVVDLPGPIELPALARWLESSGNSLLRAKGWVRAADGSAKELQAVGRRWTLTPSDRGGQPQLVLLADDRALLDRAEADLIAMTLPEERSCR